MKWRQQVLYHITELHHNPEYHNAKESEQMQSPFYIVPIFTVRHNVFMVMKIQVEAFRVMKPQCCGRIPTFWRNMLPQTSSP